MDITKIEEYKSAFDLVAQNGDPKKEEVAFAQSHRNC